MLQELISVHQLHRWDLLLSYLRFEGLYEKIPKDLIKKNNILRRCAWQEHSDLYQSCDYTVN